jgi:hypothetical protein
MSGEAETYLQNLWEDKRSLIHIYNMLVTDLAEQIISEGAFLTA